MTVERVAPVLTTLKPSQHPYLNGPWTPVHSEVDATDLEVIEGAIPKDLDGVYLRNTQNQVHEPLGFFHPFEGDGMIHRIDFQNGSASYRNRWVRTRGFAAEQEAGGSLWGGFVDPLGLSQRPGFGFFGSLKDASNTDIVVHAGRALSMFYFCGEGYRLDPQSLETEGIEGWVPIDGISAHAKVNEATGELYFFNYSARPPFVHYGVVNAHNRLVAYRPVPFAGPRIVHDMAFSEHWSILADCPLLLSPNGFVLDRSLPTRFALVPRDGSAAEVRWFEAAPTFVQHWLNAYEEGDEVILDGYFQEDPTPPSPEGYPAEVAPAFAIIDAGAVRTRLHRWRFNLADGTTREERLDDDRTVEFGLFDARRAGQKYRYVYDVTFVPGRFLFNGWVKHDLETGQSWELPLDEGRVCSETPFAPRIGSKGEDDGYLVSFVIDENADTSECWVIDARRIEDGPVARIALPHKISSGTHTCWAARERLRSL